MSKLFTNPDYLKKLLSDAGIPVGLWGIGEAKEVFDLAKEISEGESYLRIDGDGLCRVTEIVKMEIRDSDRSSLGCLMEVGEYLADGRYQKRWQEPSGQIRGSEDAHHCLGRELLEELKLQEFQYVVNFLRKYSESRSSKSYPGLQTLYVIHRFKVDLKVNVLPVDGEFVIEQADGTKVCFQWHWPPGKDF